MRVTRLVVLAVLLCIVMQTVTSRKLKFKTFGDPVGGGGGSIGPTPTPSPSGGGGSTTGGGGNTEPDRNGTNGTSGTWGDGPTNGGNTTWSSGCTTMSCKLNETRTNYTNSGSTGAIEFKGTWSNLLSNYTDVDETKTRTDVTVATTDYQRKIVSNSTTGTEVFLAGDSGLLRVQAVDSSNFIAVKFRKLSDSDGQKARDFENATCAWDGPTLTTRNGIKASVLTCSLDLVVDTVTGGTDLATIWVEVLTFNESGTMPYGNNSLKVDARSIKVSYNITWPFFKDSGSFLYLAVTVNSNKNGINTSTDGIKIGDGRVDVPTVAYADDVAERVDLFFSKDSDDASGCQGKLLMVFPQFSIRLHYDPIFNPGEGTSDNGTTGTPGTSTGSKAAVGSSFSLITALLAVLLMLALNQL